VTLPSPRIYTYKITFKKVPYYYYGVHKEQQHNEEYWGTPITNKWCWELYEPEKQILEIFPYTDDGWLEAQSVEKRIIKVFYNSDVSCLNENCGGKTSLSILRENGKRAAIKNKENNIGIFSLSPQEIKENASKGGKIGGKINAKNKTGVCGRSKEKMTEDGKKGGKISGKKNKELKKGIHGLSFEQRSAISKRNKELGLGMFSLTKEQRIENGKKSGKIVSAQKWMCTETGHISNAGGLATYQKKRGIDTNNRMKLL
jgi:hypothetical protein